MDEFGPRALGSEATTSASTANSVEETSVLPSLSILVVNYASWGECVGALRSFSTNPPRRADGSILPFEVIVVDNASPVQDQDAIRAMRALLPTYPSGGRLILHDQNGGYSTGMNLAYSHARGDYILVSNPDVIVLPGCIDALMRAIDRDDSVGAALPQIWWDEGRTARLPPNILPTLRDLLGLTAASVSRRCLYRYSRKRTRGAVAVWDAEGDVELPMLSGCFFVMHRRFIDRIGFFDERFPLYYEDTDLSQRIKQAGKRVLQVHDADVVHLYNRSGQTDFSMALERYWISRRKYFRKWYGRFGQAVYDATQRFLKTGWAKRRNQRPPQPGLTDIGSHNKKPVLRFARSYERFCVEFALDPFFFLAGGTFGSGDRWVAPDSMFKLFGPTTYYFRVVDIVDPAQPVIGVYRYTHVSPQVFEPMEVSG